jgi:WD40 repeat protein
MALPDQVAVAPDGRTLAAGGRDGSVRVWDRSSGRSVARVFVSSQTRSYTLVMEWAREYLRVGKPIWTESVRTLAFSPDGNLFLALGSQGTVTVWNTVDWQEVYTVGGERSPVAWAAFSPAGALVTCVGGQVQFRNPRSGELDTVLGEIGGSAAVCVAFSRSGEVAVAHQDRHIRLWDGRTNRKLDDLIGHMGEVVALAFSPDGRTLASASHDRTVKLWSVAAAAMVASLEAHHGKVHCLAFSPDGTTLASGGETLHGRGEVYLWRAPRP